MPDIRIKDIVRTVSDPKPSEFVETDHATDGSGKLDLQAYLLKHVATRAVADCLVSDGATANRAVVHTPGAPGNVAGMAAHFHGLVYVPESNPSTTSFIFALSSAFPLYTDVAWGLHLHISTTGVLNLMQNGAVEGTDKRTLSYATFRAKYSGQRVLIAVDFPTGDSTTNPIISANGVNITSLFTLSTAGTVPNWMPATLNCTKFLSGFNWPVGRFVPAQYGPGAWSAAENLAFAQTGLLPTWWGLGTGSAVPKHTFDFSAGIDILTGSPNATRAGNVDTDADGPGLPPSNDWFRSVGIGAGDVGTYTSILTVGHRYRAKFSLVVKPGTSFSYMHVSGASAYNQGFHYDYFPQAAFTLTPGTQQEVDVSFTASSGLFAIGQCNSSGAYINGVAGDTFYLKNLIIYDLGPVAKPVSDPNFGLRDLGANGIHGVHTAGISYVGEKVDSLAVFKVSHSGSGPLQFAGGTAIDTAKGWVIESLIVRSTAAVTWSLGNASGGAQYVSAYSLTVGDNYIPAASLVTRLISGTNLWSQSNAAADITIILNLRRTY